MCSRLAVVCNTRLACRLLPDIGSSYLAMIGVTRLVERCEAVRLPDKLDWLYVLLTQDLPDLPAVTRYWWSDVRLCVKKEVGFSHTAI